MTTHVQEVFSNRFGTTKAIVCSCGFATTHTLASELDGSGAEFFKRQHDEHLEVQRRLADLERAHMRRDRAVKQIVESLNEYTGSITVAIEPPPVDRTARVLTDGSPVPEDQSHTKIRADGQQDGSIGPKVGT